MSKKLNTSIAKIKNSSGEFEPMAALVGQSPYELAVEAGFEGTEQDWLEMMIGNGWVGAFQELEKNTTKLKEETVPKTRKINGQTLESDVDLTSEHIKASNSTKDLYGMHDTAFNKINTDDMFVDLAYTRAIGSYLAFVGNVNSDQLDAAFGKNNEETVRGIGMALAMYAKWKNPEINIATEFPNLIKCSKLGDFSGAAVNEAKNNTDILALLNTSTYYVNNYERSMFAKELSYYANIENEFDDLDVLLNDNAALNSVLNSKTAIQYMIDNTTRPSVFPMHAMNQSELVKSKFTVYDTVGEQNIVIPDDVNSIMVVLIGGGGPRSTDNTRSGGVAGAYRVFAVDTSKQKEFSAVVGDFNTATSFGDLIAEPAKGHDLYGETSEHYLCGLSGDGVSNDSAKSGTAGWGGGYGGAQGGTRSPGYNGIYGGQGGYGGGDGISSTTAGGTGTKYYGVNGTSGQGCIVVYHKR